MEKNKTFVSSLCRIVQRPLSILLLTRNCLKQWIENDSEAHDGFASETQKSD